MVDNKETKESKNFSNPLEWKGLQNPFKDIKPCSSFGEFKPMSLSEIMTGKKKSKN